jgi:hypothetical protein
MSQDFFSFSICCISEKECSKDDNYQDLSEDESKSNEESNNKLYRLISEYQLTDERCIKRDGNVICGWCQETITDHKTTLVICISCQKFMGHPVCFKYNKICPYCISII